MNTPSSELMKKVTGRKIADLELRLAAAEECVELLRSVPDSAIASFHFSVEKKEVLAAYDKTKEPEA